jgi:ATP phosphoribosyltransferase regulatory subunit
MNAKRYIKAEADDLIAFFEAAGATRVEADILQPADTLLDLYGEDIRARAYVTHDPLRGELMLRPDFTVPVVQMHMDGGAEPARYTYAGEVFRAQEEDTDRPSEYIQVGYEVFDRENPAAADAEVFALFSEVLTPLGLRAVTGDLGILMAAVQGLKTTERRKAALMRHIWRPRRFRALLDRFSGRTSAPASREKLLVRLAELGAERLIATGRPAIGARDEGEILERLQTLKDDAAEPPISRGEADLLDEIVHLREVAPNALEHLLDIAVDVPMIRPALDRMSARLEALASRGIEIETLEFEGSHGRTTLEYYDGFVFGFTSPTHPELPPVATGGRYDALTRVLGGGKSIPAVGGVIRPELIARLKGDSA